MFGLMRPQSCCTKKSTDQNYLYHRRHYCGTCKSIGQNFGQGSRLLLNFDTVFLSELLSHLNEEDLTTWETNLQSINTCFSMPQKSSPFSLQYAAIVSVLLGELKIDDNIKDLNGFCWKIARRGYSKAFKKAIIHFTNLGIDIKPIYGWIDQQAQREQIAPKLETLAEHLDYYAETTANITAQLFKAGGQRLKKTIDLYQLGYQFGQLMYILDAFEDYEQDIFNQQFNPLAIYWESNNNLTINQLELVRKRILLLEQHIIDSIQKLPLSTEIKEVYSNRLTSNLALRLYKERTIPKTIVERIVLRWEFAKEFAGQVTCQPYSLLRQLNYYVIVLAVFINPQTTSYLPQEGKLQIAGWGLLVTAILAGIGITGVVRRNRKEKRKQKRQKKRLKRFVKKLKNFVLGKRSCWSECFSSCCDSCFSSCCDGCCESICESENPLFWLLLIGAIVLITGLVLLILFLVGVI